jgi:hypothetical protein
MRLVARGTVSDTSSMLLKRFPLSNFFNFGKKSKSGGLMSGLYGGWGSTCHAYFSNISNTAAKAWDRALSFKMRTPAASMSGVSWRIFWAQNILQKLSVVRICLCYSGPQRQPVCCYHSILVIRHNHHELNFRLLAATFWGGGVRRSFVLPLRGLTFQFWFKLSYPCLIYGNSVQ